MFPKLAIETDSIGENISVNQSDDNINNYVFDYIAYM